MKLSLFSPSGRVAWSTRGTGDTTRRALEDWMDEPDEPLDLVEYYLGDDGIEVVEAASGPVYCLNRPFPDNFHEWIKGRSLA